MKTFTIRVLLAVWLTSTGVVVLARAQDGEATPRADASAIEAFAPKPVLELVHARQFRIEEPYGFAWCSEQPQITEGTVIVVRVENALAYPKECAMPVLFVNGRPAEQTNIGYESGHLVLIVPGKVDLAKARIYHGAPAMAEQIDAEYGSKQLAWAARKGVEPIGQKQADKALASAAGTFASHDMSGVYAKLVADLIERYSPKETDRIEIYRLAAQSR